MKTKIQIKSVFGKILFEYEKENNSIKDTLIEAIKQKIDLRGSDLRGSDLRGSDLSYSDLRYSDLRGSDLRGSDLRGSDLSYSDLRGSDLRGSDLSNSDLRGSDLDYSSLHFSCKSRKPKTDEKQRIQLAHHFLSWIKYAENATDEEKQIFESLKSYANRFHRNDVEKF